MKWMFTYILGLLYMHSTASANIPKPCFQDMKAQSKEFNQKASLECKAVSWVTPESWDYNYKSDRLIITWTSAKLAILNLIKCEEKLEYVSPQDDELLYRLIQNKLTVCRL